MRLFVLLNSWRSFFCLNTFNFLWHLSNIIFKILGDFVFRAWLFLELSSWLSLLMAVNFFLFLRAIIEESKINQQCFKTALTIIFLKKLEKLRFKFSRNTLFTATVQLFFCVLRLQSSYLYLFLGGKHNCLHAKSTYKQGKVLALKKSKQKCRLLWEINSFSIHLFPHRTGHLHVSTENVRPNPQDMDIKLFIAAPVFYLQANNVYSIIGKKITL